MKNIKLFVFLTLFAATAWISGFSQEDKPPAIYNPEADAKAEILAAIESAKAENKHVLLQVGGNWCSWCLRFHKFVHDVPGIDSLVNANFVYVLVNYSRENKNTELLEQLGFPQRFGFPVFVILDSSGNRIHTQNSAYLEEGKSYSEAKVKEFIQQWSPAALDPANY